MAELAQHRGLRIVLSLVVVGTLVFLWLSWPASPAGATNSNMGTYDTFWYDPANLLLTETHTAGQGDFDSSGQTIDNQCIDSRGAYYGWGETYHTLGCYSYQYDVGGRTDEAYYDSAFCGGTWIYIDKSNVDVTTNYVSGWDDSNYAVGCDADILWTNAYAEPGAYY